MKKLTIKNSNNMFLILRNIGKEELFFKFYGSLEECISLIEDASEHDINVRAFGNAEKILDNDYRIEESNLPISFFDIPYEECLYHHHNHGVFWKVIKS